jgi:hypothetical protein
MHTDTDKQIEALIARRRKLENATTGSSDDILDVADRITDINLQIMRLQGRKADGFPGGNGSAAIDPELAICKTCGKTFSLATGHDCGGLVPRKDATADAVKSLLQDARNADARRFAEQVAGIEEKIVWTTKDGKTWDRLEDAIKHQRRGHIINAIYEADESNAEWIAVHAEQIADHAAALFAMLEPFFRKGE